MITVCDIIVMCVENHALRKNKNRNIPAYWCDLQSNLKQRESRLTIINR